MSREEDYSPRQGCLSSLFACFGFILGPSVVANGRIMAANSEQLYDKFQTSCVFTEILESFQSLRESLGIENSVRGLAFYRQLKLKLTAWKWKAVTKILDARASQKEYQDGNACCGQRALIVGAGPAGLRMAIECALLGADVVVVEKRLSMTRNNVLHLWPFCIEDLRLLAAKKFYGKFCAGSLDHIGKHVVSR